MTNTTRGTTHGSRITDQIAREVAEGAREATWAKPSFAREMFMGRFRPDLVPRPADPRATPAAAKFLDALAAFLATVDAERIEREDKVYPEVIEGLRRLGAFGIKIPAEYGGLGFGQVTYNEAVALAALTSAGIAALLSAHQSIGLPQPLKMFGTEAQKKRYLPRLAAGAISAFALTEPDVGSDPARLATTAEPDGAGGWILNGTKLWCTNGPIAELLVVMASTPPKSEGARRGITAFIVETSAPGVETLHRSTFMGLKGMENGVMSFKDVRLAADAVLWGEGKGLKLALSTLNTGRLTLPAMCAAAGGWSLGVVREWAAVREQWGRPVGEHEAVAHKIADIASRTVGMQALADVSATMADAECYDIRLEAALAKMWNSESAWRVVDEALQVRGGRGYETAASLAARGEPAIPLERTLRDMRINMIFEGSSEIMRLFVAREAVDVHLKASGDLMKPGAIWQARLRGALSLTAHMARWLPALLLPPFPVRVPGMDNALRGEVEEARYLTRRIGRAIAWAMIRSGPSLERRQAVLARIVEAGAEVFAMVAACRAASAREDGGAAVVRTKAFCRDAADRATTRLDNLHSSLDAPRRKFAAEVLLGMHKAIER